MNTDEWFKMPDGHNCVKYSTLRGILPTVEDALFFAKLYQFDARKLGELLQQLFNNDVVQALTEGCHSTELQDYLVETVPDEVELVEVEWDEYLTPPEGYLMPQLWQMELTTIADSIQQVADKLVSSMARLATKNGQMVFRTLAKMNANRPVLGVYAGGVSHQVTPKVLVVLDVSGSMSSNTIERIVEDVVALAWAANATLAVVSTNTYCWEPGTSSVQSVLNTAEYGWTCYETLAPLLEEDWGTVFTIADYDGSADAKRIASQASGTVGQVYDLSLVNEPTFLSEVIATRSSQPVRHLLIAARNLR